MDSRSKLIQSLRDVDWVRKKHLLSASDLDAETKRWRLYSSAHTKYTNASLGGNFPINQPPAFTRYADVRSAGTSLEVTSKYTNRHGKRMLGPGRYWSEAYDDNRVEVHMRFGTPRFNGFATFFMNFYSHKAGLLAREGRASISYYAGLGVGSILALPATAFIFVGKIASFLMGRPSSKYYYMVQNMALYWNRVNFIVNQIQVKRQLSPDKISGILDKESPLPQEDWGYPDTQDYINSAAKNFPMFRSSDGYIDAYNVARGPQLLQNERVRQIENIIMGATSKEEIRKRMRAYLDESTPSVSMRGDITDYLKRYHTSVVGDMEHQQADPLTEKFMKTDLTESATPAPPVAAPEDQQQMGAEEGSTAPTQETTPAKADAIANAETPNFFSKSVETEPGVFKTVLGFGSQLLNSSKGVAQASDYLDADLREGSQFVTFAVQPSTVSETFSNSVSNSAIEERLNGLSKTASIARFALSDGKTGLGVIDGIIGAARDFVAGTLDGMHLSGLVALAGNAYVDIPKDYESSSTQWPSSSYTMELRAIYGNQYSQMTRLDFPLAMLLAAGLPISTGKASYTRPFLCELYCKGRNQIRLGMIDQILVTRGTGNMGFNKWGHALGYDITFSVVDLSTVMHAPIDSTYGPTGIGGPLGVAADSASKIVNSITHFFDDENAFNDYLAVLASLSMGDQIYLKRRLAIRMASKQLDLSSYFSTSHWSNEFANGETIQMLAGIFTPANARIM